jgi:hypothetical protein
MRVTEEIQESLAVTANLAKSAEQSTQVGMIIVDALLAGGR